MADPLPDAICKATGDGDIGVAMNRKARRFINTRTDRKPRWGRLPATPDSVISSPEYRVLILKPGPIIPAMLSSLYEAGMLVLVKCPGCGEFHAVDDELAKRMKMDAVAGADGVLPSHPTLQ